jgi:hypothetical protein
MVNLIMGDNLNFEPVTYLMTIDPLTWRYQVATDPLTYYSGGPHTFRPGVVLGDWRIVSINVDFHGTKDGLVLYGRAAPVGRRFI